MDSNTRVFFREVGNVEEGLIYVGGAVGEGVLRSGRGPCWVECHRAQAE